MFNFESHRKTNRCNLKSFRNSNMQFIKQDKPLCHSVYSALTHDSILKTFVYVKLSYTTVTDDSEISGEQWMKSLNENFRFIFETLALKPRSRVVWPGYIIVDLSSVGAGQLFKSRVPLISREFRCWGHYILCSFVFVIAPALSFCGFKSALPIVFIGH